MSDWDNRVRNEEKKNPLSNVQLTDRRVLIDLCSKEEINEVFKSSLVKLGFIT